MKVAFHTLGCKVNQNDTEGLMSLFAEAGYEIVQFGDSADVYVVNTCAVTQIGAAKSRQMIRKAIGFDPRVVVATGCYPQVSPDEVRQIDGVDLIIGMSERPQIVTLVEQFLNGQTADHDLSNDVWVDLPGTHLSEKTRATLKIQEGCEQFCSYCIIPYARGKVKSMPPEAAVAAFKNLLADGFQEIVLTGIHLGCYGKDLRIAFKDLLKQLLMIPGDFRIRLGSLEPLDFDDELLEIILHSEKICPYFHLPLQSGCNRILNLMNRHYDQKYYADLLGKIRAAIPNAGIGTDLIVGFPGETADDFNDTLEFIKQMNFSKIHVFKYSPRTGTPAAKMPNRIAKAVQEQRSHEVIALGTRMAMAFAQSFVGKTIEVLFEEAKDGKQTGLSGEYLRVLVDSDKNLKNQRLFVRVIGVDDNADLLGVLSN